MRRKKFLSLIFCVNNVLFCCCGDVAGSPTQNLHNNIAANKFQSAVQQQSFFSILTSIEERLRNLDSIYSMQLSQTLENKLDLYNRRLEALDMKIIRLESLVMLNLDKISENISTKNFKDDMTKTNTLRKIDSVYEGISHRLSYIERKYETNIVKVQAKMDAALTRLEKIEETMATRDSDMEAELSDAIFAIDDLKTTYTVMEGKLLNITNSTFNISRDTYKLLSNINMENKKSLNKFHDNIIENLQYIDNKTSARHKTTEENNIMLKSMKTELKEDFNDYANKVADMNSYIWKNSDTTEDDLKTIATVVNSTKIEVQNGVRSLMLQIGKLSNKENAMPVGSNNFEDINQKLTTNFEKILTNQNQFLESCYRLQMDESQIESEISVMLEKLIDMLERKMASEMKDVKNLEKVLKSHDFKVNRNVYQVNNNVISLFEKSTIHHEGMKDQVTKITNDLNALFAYVQSTTPARGSDSSTIDLKVIMDKLNKLENLVNHSNVRRHSELNITNIQDTYTEQRLSDQMESNSKILHAIESQISKNFNKENIDKMFSTILPKYFNCNINEIKIKSINETEIDEDTRKAITDIFGSNTDSMKVQFKSPYDTSKKSKCKKNHCKNLLDIRVGTDENWDENNDNIKGGGRKKKRRPVQIDVRSNLDSSDYNLEHDASEETTEHTTQLEILTDETVMNDNNTETTTTNNEYIVYSLAEIKPNDTISET